MKIIYDDIIYSLQKGGGISVYWTEIMQNGKNIKHYVYDNANNNIFYKKIKLENVSVLSSKFLLFKRFLPIRCDKSDVYLFHSSYYRYSMDKTAINITTVHDFTVEKFQKGLHAWVHKWMMKRAVNHSQGIICVSNNTLKDFKVFFSEYRGEVTVVQNGYNKKNFYVDEKREKDIEKIVLFVGARAEYKCFDFACRIVGLLEDIRFLIIGGGDLNSKEKKLLDQNVSGRYEKKDFISDEELRELYSRAFFLCYPSRYEGFGIPLLEAQACGCPVVCQNCSSIPEVVGGSAIFVDENDIDNSLREIKKLYNKEFYFEIRNNGLENVKRFSWEKANKETRVFYERVFNKYGK